MEELLIVKGGVVHNFARGALKVKENTSTLLQNANNLPY
jgi:hypothetical protein